MLKDLAVDMACLVGCWCATLLYGVNVVLYFSCIYVLVYKRTSQKLNWILISASTIQFLIATAHICTVLRALIEGFVWSGRIAPEEIRAYWLDKSHVTHVVEEGLYTANSLIGDAILVWRLYVLYPKPRWISVGPMLLVIADTAVGYKTLSLLAGLKSTDPIFVNRITHWLLATWSISITVQVVATSLIAWKIWHTAYQTWSLTSSTGERTHLTIIRIIVESGSIYTLTTVTWMVIFVLKLEAEEVVAYPIAQISALAPALIIVRVGLNIHHGAFKSSQNSSFTQPSNRRSRIPIEVNISREVHKGRAGQEYSMNELTTERKTDSELTFWESDSQSQSREHV